MTTEKLLALSPEEKVENWFDVNWGIEEILLPGPVKESPGRFRGVLCYKLKTGETVVDPMSILDSQSAWIKYVVKPMQEMGFDYDIYNGLEMGGGSKWFIWRQNKNPYRSPIQNDNIFLTSLDAAFQVPEVLGKINGR